MKKRIYAILTILLIVMMSVGATSCWSLIVDLNDPYPEYKELKRQENGLYKLAEAEYYRNDADFGDYQFFIIGEWEQVGKVNDLNAMTSPVYCGITDVERNVLIGAHDIYFKTTFDLPEKEELEFNSIGKEAKTSFSSLIEKSTVHIDELIDREVGVYSFEDLEKTNYDYRLYLGLSDYSYLGCSVDICVAKDNIYIANFYKSDYNFYKVEEEYEVVFQSAINDIKTQENISVE